MTTEISSFETDVNDILIEYLDFNTFNNTKINFIAELKERGKSIPKTTENAESIIGSNEIQESLMNAFHRGDKHGFFELWNSKLSAKLRNEDSVCQKLEFYCQIFFAIYSIKKNFQNKDEETLAMQGFREYLETRGASLSKSTEFVRFYALPYVSNPQEHPSFVELFQDSWVPGLELRLKRFFQLVFGQRNEPRLVSLYKQRNSDKDDVVLKQLQTKVVESERRANQYMKRLNQVQIDYHSLIGISAELVDLLEGSLQGIPVSPSHLQSVCQKLLYSQQHRLKSNGIPLNTSIDLSRPGTASMMLRQSIQLTNGGIANSLKSSDPTVLQNSNNKSAPLNYNKLKFDLEHDHLRMKVLLLQAFRWRLTKTDVYTRNKFISEITQNDLLGLEPGTYHDAIFSMMNSLAGSEQLQEYFARLINAIATLCKGRSYLVKNSSICELLYLNIISLTHKECIFRENLIGALQKLSLRRHIQTYLISSGMLEWLMQLLEENSHLSDYTLDYSVALLMNLCLRTSGKKRCVENKERIIRVLSKMLDSFNKEIASYVNGALYSILVMPEIRQEAIKVDLGSVLRNHMKAEHPDMNRQLEFIIKQLESNDEPKIEESDDEEEDDDEEDPEIMESELDKDETAIANKDELNGENLLRLKFSLSSTNQKENQEPNIFNPTINRPITPGTFLAKRASTIEETDKEKSSSRSGSSMEKRQSIDKSANPQPKPVPITENPNYKEGFSSNPKIPRTPDQENLKRNSILNMTGPIPSSGRLPTPSHKNGNRKGKESMSTIK